MAISIIPSAEIHGLPNSFIDPNGMVFEWEGQLYRSVTGSHASFCRNLFDTDTVPDLIRRGLLVDSELTDLSLQPGDLVLRHRTIPVVTYCFEWPAVMLKEAAKLTLQLCTRLADKNLTLQDGHPWNILFDGTNPVFVDMGSIVPARDDILWAPYQQFCNFFLFPLYLFSAGQDRIARWLLHDYLEGVTHADVIAALPLTYKLRRPWKTLGLIIPKVLAGFVDHFSREFQDKIWNFSRRIHGNVVTSRVRRRFFDSLFSQIERLKLPQKASHWSIYYEKSSLAHSSTKLPAAEWGPKKERVTELLSQIRPRTVLDLGCNTGYYSELAASQGSRVIACDQDPSCVQQCYDTAKGNGLDIVPLVFNGFSPTPAYGWGARECPSATDRFRSELVLVLAVIHHVVADQRMDLMRISDLCHKFSDRWLLIEFVPPMERKAGTSTLPALDSFTLTTLSECLRQRFKKVAVYDSFPQERKLFLCEK